MNIILIQVRWHSHPCVASLLRAADLLMESGNLPEIQLNSEWHRSVPKGKMAALEDGLWLWILLWPLPFPNRALSNSTTESPGIYQSGVDNPLGLRFSPRSPPLHAKIGLERTLLSPPAFYWQSQAWCIGYLATATDGINCLKLHVVCLFFFILSPLVFFFLFHFSRNLRHFSGL